MELFDLDGCLTNEGIQMILDENLEELQRLEASEHLSFCDDCLLRYTNAVCNRKDDELLIPERNIIRNVILTIKQKTVALFYHRYVAVAIAASFSILITFSGVFDSFISIDFSQPRNNKYKWESTHDFQEFQQNTNRALKEFFSLSFLEGE